MLYAGMNIADVTDVADSMMFQIHLQCNTVFGSGGGGIVVVVVVVVVVVFVVVVYTCIAYGLPFELNKFWHSNSNTMIGLMYFFKHIGALCNKLMYSTQFLFL
jgi:hypothetical protein